MKVLGLRSHRNFDSLCGAARTPCGSREARQKGSGGSQGSSVRALMGTGTVDVKVSKRHRMIPFPVASRRAIGVFCAMAPREVTV
jgi:hypothetical protein